MRILHIAKSQHIAGAENYLFELLPRLVQRGYEVHLMNLYDLTTGEKSQSYETELERLQNAGVRIHRDSVRHKLDVASVPRIRKVVETVQPTVVHTHMPYADLFGAMAARWAGFGPIISSRHHDYSFSWKEKTRFLSWYMVANRFLDGILPVSERVASLAVNHEGWDEANIQVIHHGCEEELVDHDESRAMLTEKFGIPSNSFVVGTVARLIHWKGHRYAVEALRQLLINEHRVHWLFIGDGPEREKLQNQAQKAEVSNNLHFLGHRNDVPQLLSGVDLMVHPTTGEAFGIVLIEAMAQGTPILASNTGAIPEIVVDGETGVLVPSRNANALAHEIELLKGDPQTRSDLGQLARKRYLTHFTPESMVDETIRAYQRVIDGSTSSR